MNPTDLYIELANANILTHKGRGGSTKLPDYLTINKDDLKPGQKELLHQVLDEEIDRLVEASDNEVLDVTAFSNDSEALKKRLQLLVDGVKYRAPDRGEKASEAIKSKQDTSRNL